jgi:hypothetical protein
VFDYNKKIGITSRGDSVLRLIQDIEDGVKV